MSRSATRALAAVSFAIGGGSLLLFGGFLLFGNPWSFGLVRTSRARLGWDALLCLVFFLQHSGMIRRGAKRWFADRVPEGSYTALYSIASGLTLLALVLLWQPTDRILYELHGALRWLPLSLFALAFAGFAWGVRSLRGFDPFGTLALQAGPAGATPPVRPPFAARGAYRHVRHPFYFAMLLLIWSTPRLSTDRLLFNLLWTAWIVVGTRLEERDLVAEFGPTYLRYQREVPMLLPLPRRRRDPERLVGTGRRR